jgi:hypothetical protein
MGKLTSIITSISKAAQGTYQGSIIKTVEYIVDALINLDSRITKLEEHQDLILADRSDTESRLEKLEATPKAKKAPAKKAKKAPEGDD